MGYPFANTPLLVLTKRHSHHSSSGGFDRLADYLDCTRLERLPLGRLSKLLKKTVHRYWQKDPNLIEYFYQYEDLLAEQRTLIYSWALNARICHVLYGDEQLDLLLKYRSLLKSKLVATFHLPFDRSSSRFHAQYDLMSRGIDHFVAVSSDLASDLATLFGSSRVSFIPHGVDMFSFPYVKGGNRREGNLNILIVGWHMRDLEMIHRIVDYAYFNKLNIKFTFVGPESVHSLFTGCYNIDLFSGISEQALIHKYHSSDALLMPLIASTANNSILESLACGTPVITTNVGGVPDYVDSHSGWILPKGDFMSHVRLLEYLAQNQSECYLKRPAARQQALQFSWERVAGQYHQLFQHLLNDPVQ